MNSGMVSFDRVMTIAFEQVANPDGIMSIFAGGVFWESVDQFEQNCDQEPEHALNRLLEVRVYAKDREFHAVRDSIDESREFSWRTIVDDESDVESIDDIHYLDIDEKRSNVSEGLYRATGGGVYTLPVKAADRVKVRNYIDYDSDGLAYIADFRIVGLMREGE